MKMGMTKGRAGRKEWVKQPGHLSFAKSSGSAELVRGEHERGGKGSVCT